MKILLTIPTLAELYQIQKFFPGEVKPIANEFVWIQGHQINTKVTGAGMVNAAAKTCMFLLEDRYDLAIQAGIAGTFSADIPLGITVEVTSEFLPEFGVEDGDEFMPFMQLGLSGDEQYPQPTDGILRNHYQAAADNIKKARGITVNRVTGSEKKRNYLLELYPAEIESMEGFGFFFSCILNQTPFICIRGISNRVGKRERSSWKIAEALEATAIGLHDIFLKIGTKR
jgi:futalosine hydrolase